MRHGSLFTGIGGFDLAAEWMGWTNIFQVENNKYCQSLLNKRFPETNKSFDIQTFDTSPYRGSIDIISGGFPCQPFSVAGKRSGTEDPRYLWPAMLKVIHEIKPQWVVGENVLGLLNWNEGLLFEQVCADLEIEGYEVQAYVLPACGVNAPYRRERVWIVAYSNGTGLQETRPQFQTERSIKYRKLFETPSNTKSKQSTPGSNPKISKARKGKSRGSHSPCYTTYTYRQWKSQSKGIISNKWGRSGNGGEEVFTYPMLSRCQQDGEVLKAEQFEQDIPNWRQFPTVSPVCRRNDGISARVDRLKALGNAIVPQVAYQIFQSIQDLTNELNQPQS